MGRKLDFKWFLLALVCLSLLSILHSQAPTFSPASGAGGGGGGGSFAFIDQTGIALLGAPITIPASQYVTFYLDCPPSSCSAGAHYTGFSLTDGTIDGQILNIACSNLNADPSNTWNVTMTLGPNLSQLLLGGSNLGSYDHGGTINPGNVTISSDGSCGATLMWSNSNGYWELTNIYGGTDD